MAMDTRESKDTAMHDGARSGREDVEDGLRYATLRKQPSGVKRHLYREGRPHAPALSTCYSVRVPASCRAVPREPIMGQRKAPIRERSYHDYHN